MLFINYIVVFREGKTIFPCLIIIKFIQDVQICIWINCTCFIIQNLFCGSISTYIVLYCHFYFQYLVELSLIDSETFLRFLPSQIAAAAVCLASHTVGNEPWVSRIVNFKNLGKDVYLNITTDFYYQVFTSN